MKVLLAAVALTVFAAAAPASAQTVLDHRVQRAWDEVFDPPRRGDPRTNWERRRDIERQQRRIAAERAGWCREHPGHDRCRRVAYR